MTSISGCSILAIKLYYSYELFYLNGLKKLESEFRTKVFRPCMTEEQINTKNILTWLFYALIRDRCWHWFGNGAVNNMKCFPCHSVKAKFLNEFWRVKKYITARDMHYPIVGISRQLFLKARGNTLSCQSVLWVHVLPKQPLFTCC